MVSTAVKHFGRLDVLVNNAGVHEGGAPLEVTNDQWRKVMATDLDGVFYGCRAALPHLEKTKGSIVNTASVSGLGGDWGMSPYNAAKGAVVNLTRALEMDVGKKGVRINAVCPSLTRTGMTADMSKSGRRSQFPSQRALPRRPIEQLFKAGFGFGCLGLPHRHEDCSPNAKQLGHREKDPHCAPPPPLFGR